jgi:diguanylate cyclase (GGDEF)-like protein
MDRAFKSRPAPVPGRALRVSSAWQIPAWICVVVVAGAAIHNRTATPLVIAGMALVGCALLLFQRQHARLRALAWTDPLTGLVNHRGFQDLLRTELARASRDRGTVALVALDMDDFKRVNDSHGHPYGDQVLRSAGRRLAAAVRTEDTVARVGGEEFALILPGVDPQGALEIAERARAAVARVPVHELKVSCSAGIASFPDDAEDASSLCQLADGALYWAKRTGKHRTRRFDPKHVALGVTSRRTDELEELLSDERSIQPAFQPVVALATGRVDGYEALSRFPGGSRRSAEAWFTEAEACGLGARLEAAAIRAALRPLGRPPGTHLAVNVSPSALLSPEVQGCLPADLTDLVIEITEHEEIAATDEVLQELDQLRRRGALIAIDDAGAGYSGLKKLMRVRPDIVKLDRELIDGLHADAARLALVESFVRFAQRIGATVCAEGIESLDDLAAVADLDVPWGQGFALARPGAGWPTVDPIAVEVCRTALDRALRGPASDRQPIVAPGDPLLERLSAALASARSQGDLEQALEMIAAELNADKICLSLLHPHSGTIQTLAESGERSAEERFALSTFPLTKGVVTDREPSQVMVGDPRADAAEVELLLSLGYRALLMVPVVHRGESLGLVEAFSERERAWTRAEINRARIISNQFASVIGAFFMDGSRPA